MEQRIDDLTVKGALSKLYKNYLLPLLAITGILLSTAFSISLYSGHISLCEIVNSQ